MSAPTPTITPTPASPAEAVRRSPRRALTAAVALAAAAGLGATGALVVPPALATPPTLTVRLYADDATAPTARVTVAGMPPGSGGLVTVEAWIVKDQADCHLVDWTAGVAGVGAQFVESRQASVGGDHPTVILPLSGIPGCMAIDATLTRDGKVIARVAPGALGTTGSTSGYMPLSFPAVSWRGTYMKIEAFPAAADGRPGGFVDYAVYGPRPAAGCRHGADTPWVGAPRVLQDSVAVPSDVPSQIAWALDPGCYQVTLTVIGTDGRTSPTSPTTWAFESP